RLHHALHGRSGAPLQPGGDHRPRQDHRRGDQGRAGARHGRRQARSGDGGEGADAGERVPPPDRKGVARMISAVIRTGWLNLRRDRGALILSFIVPIVFFSIFAGIFGAQRSKTPKVTLAIADEDRSERSKQLIKALRAESALKIVESKKDDPNKFDAKSAEAYVREGDAPVA